MKSRTKKIDKNLVEGLPEDASLQAISDKTDVFFSYSHRLDGKMVWERDCIGTVKVMKFVPNNDYIDQKHIKSERPLNNRTHEKKRKIKEEKLTGSVRKSSRCVKASVATGFAEEMTFNELKNQLTTPRIIFDKDGKGHWLDVTKRQHEIAARLGSPELYKIVPEWKLN